MPEQMRLANWTLLSRALALAIENKIRTENSAIKRRTRLKIVYG